MTNKSYKVGYKDDQSIRQQICTLAKDSFDAKLAAMSQVKYLRDHPHAIDCIDLME